MISFPVLPHEKGEKLSMNISVFKRIFYNRGIDVLGFGVSLLYDPWPSTLWTLVRTKSSSEVHSLRLLWKYVPMPSRPMKLRTPFLHLIDSH